MANIDPNQVMQSLSNMGMGENAAQGQDMTTGLGYAWI